MKLSLKKTIYLLTICVVTTAFVSCGNKTSSSSPAETKPGQTPSQQPTQQPVTGKAYYHVEFGKDMPLISSAAITYTGSDGNQMTETVTGLTWTKELTGITVPFKANLKIDFSPKEGFNTQDKYEVGWAYDMRVTAGVAPDEKLKSASDSRKMTIKGDRVEKYINERLNKPAEASVVLE